jgi:hypothetical protein
MPADIHEFEAVVTNTTKPIVFIGYSPRGAEERIKQKGEKEHSAQKNLKQYKTLRHGMTA